jgi:hypothetical protein
MSNAGRARECPPRPWVPVDGPQINRAACPQPGQKNMPYPFQMAASDLPILDPKRRLGVFLCFLLGGEWADQLIVLHQ